MSSILKGITINESLQDDFIELMKSKGYNVKPRGSIEQQKAERDAMLAQRAKDQANAPAPAAPSAEEVATAKEKLAQLERVFDKNYQYSDDHSVWSKNHDIAQQIGSLKKLIARGEQGVAEGSGMNVVKSVKVGNFRHDLVNTGMGWQVRIYNGDKLYDTGLSKNSEEKGLAALDNSVAYTKKQLNIKEQGVAEGAPELLKKEMPTHRHAEKLLAQNGVSKDDPDYYHHLNNTIKHLRQFGNIDLINKGDEQGVAEGSGGPSWPEVISALTQGYPDIDPTDALKPLMQKYRVSYNYFDKLAQQQGYKDVFDAYAEFEELPTTGPTMSKGVAEAGSPAQQAAIAINMKKRHQKPKNEAVGDVDLESAYRRALEITKQIKYDDTATQIIVEIQMLAEKTGIDMKQLNWAIDDVREAKNQLESAVYGLDEVFKEAMEQQQYRDEEGIDEDTAYGGGMGQGHTGQSYRKFTPKSAGTFNEMDSFDNGTHYTPKMAGTFKESKLKEEPDTSGPIGTQPGGWRTYRAKSAGTKMKKESSIMKGLKETGSTGTSAGSAGIGGGAMVGGPTTYEQEFDPFKRKGARRITAMTYEGKK